MKNVKSRFLCYVISFIILVSSVSMTIPVSAASSKALVKTYKYQQWTNTTYTTDYYFYAGTTACEFADGLTTTNKTNIEEFIAAGALGLKSTPFGLVLGALFLMDSNSRNALSQKIKNQAYKTGPCRFRIQHIYTRGGQIYSYSVYSWNKTTISKPNGVLYSSWSW